MKTPKALSCLLLLASLQWVAAQPSNINISPTTLSVSVGATATFRVTASGAVPFTYQWWFTNAVGDNPIDGVANPHALRSMLNLTNVQVSEAGGYYVVVTDANSLSATSGVATLNVDPMFTKITTGAPVTDLGNSWESGSWGDYDGDGYPDLFVARYTAGRSALYRNNGDGTFASITNVPFAQTATAMSGAWADFDNDGRPDLIVAPVGGRSFCYFNNGDGTFSTNQFLPTSATFSVAVADYNRDGLLDVFMPGLRGGLGLLYRNNGDGTFTRMTSADVGALVTTGMFGGAEWADYDDDGWMELYTSYWAKGRNLMFHNDGTGRFVAVTNLVTQSASPVIGGAWGDYDNDGKLDLCVACLGGTSQVYRNLGNGEFEKPAIGLTLGGANSVTWVDYDNDGFLDLFFTYPNALYHGNGDGTFTRVTTGSVVHDLPLGDGSYSSSGLWFDYDNDGFLDLYVFNGNDTATAYSANFLYHNNGNSNAWLKVRVIGTVSNRDGVGAKVHAQAFYAGQPRWQRRDITGGDAMNGNQLYAHFGLGNATVVQTLRIEWPSGAVQEYTNVATNQFLTLWEPPALSAAVRADGGCELTIKAEPNRSWQIKASSDLLTWQALTTLTNTTVEFQFTDTAAAGMACRFYRVEGE